MLTSYTPQEPPLRPSLRGLRHNSYEIAGIDIPARMDTGQRQALAISHTPAYLTSSQGLPSSLPRSIYFSLNASSDVALLSVTGSASGQSTAVGQPMTAPTNNDPHTQQAQVPSASIQQAAVPASAGPIFIPAMLRSLFAPMSSGRSRPAALVRRSAHAPGHYSVLLPNAAQQVCTNPRAAGQHAPGMVRRHQQVLFAAVSDLHLERRAGSAVALGSLFSPHVLAHADVLALLGDIGDPASPAYKSFVTACALAFPLVLLVPGR